MSDVRRLRVVDAAWRGGIVGAMLLALAPPTRAVAQEVPLGADTLSWYRTEPLIVTILRDSVDLATAPQSISLVRMDPYAALRPSLSLDAALSGVPGVQVDDRGSEALGERISIRGFGTRSQFGVRGVRVIVDGVPATMPDGQSALSHVDPASIVRAAVVRGAGSALWGNAGGGVILLESAPPPEAPFVSAGATAGSFGRRMADAGAGGRRGGVGWSARVAAVGSDGHRQFSDATQVFASAALSHDGSRFETRASFAFVDYEALNPGALPDSLAAADPGAAFPLNVRQRTGEEARQGQAGLFLRWREGASEVDTAFWGLLRDVDNPIPPAIVDLERAAGGARIVWRRAARAGGLRLVAGADLDGMIDARRNFANLDGERGDLLLDQKETVTAVGPFAQLAVAVGRRGFVHGAIRYDRVRFRVVDRFRGPDDPDDTGQRNMDAVSPSLGLSFEPAEDVTVYALASSGFDTPTTSELVNRPDGSGGLNPALDPQRSWTVELGGRVRRGGWSAELVGYRTGVRDALAPFQVPEQPGRDFFRNAGSAVHRGMEAAIGGSPLSGTALGLTYSWVVARFDEFRVEETTFDGRRLPGVAPHRLALSFDQEIGRGWRTGVRSRYVSGMPVDDANSARTSSSWISDLQLSHDGLDAGATRLVPFVGLTNVFDEEYTASVTVNAFGGRYFEPGPPRGAYGGVRFVRGRGTAGGAKGE